MTKYQIELKESAVKYFKRYGLAATIKKYGISPGTIYKWIHLYDTSGIDGLKRKESKYYSVAEKKEIVEFTKVNGPLAAFKQYNVSDSIVSKWERKLLEEGEKALSKDNRGRKLKNHAKNDISENEDLLEEVQRLRMENAYLKKLKALVQSREVKPKKKK